MACQQCGNTSDGIINGLCSSCTIKNYGCLFPWLEELEKKAAKKAADEKELPEWYHMAKSFFREISCYSSSMYEDLNGHAILNQIRYAAEREAAQQNTQADRAYCACSGYHVVVDDVCETCGLPYLPRRTCYQGTSWSERSERLVGVWQSGRWFSAPSSASRGFMKYKHWINKTTGELRKSQTKPEGFERISPRIYGDLMNARNATPPFIRFLAERSNDPAPCCIWEIHDEDANAWEGACGLVWQFEVGTPTENEMAYCPKCGRPLREKPAL